MVPAAIASMLGLSLVRDFFLSRAVYIPEGGVVPPFMVVTWGFRVRADEQIAFFFLRLPSWEWGPIDCGGRYDWLQLTLCYASDRGWFCAMSSN